MRVTRPDLVDAAFLTVLGGLALVGFANTFEGWRFLLVGLVALVAGILVAWLCTRLSVALAALAAVAAYLAVGVPLVGVALVPATVSGWKQLLTTLPPVADGPLLTVPLLLGLLCGFAGFLLARRVDRSAAPVPVPVAVLGAVILLGTTEPGARLLDGVVFALGALGWAALRGHRLRPPARSGTGRRTRLLTSGAVLAVSAVGAALLGPALPGAGGSREVVREHVTPPFDLGAYPSPLVGFRKYTKDANLLWDQELFTVSGLPTGAAVRIATLDDYNGAVWGATNGDAGNNFQRVGARISGAGPGQEATLRITIGAGYASASDVNAWLPSAGRLTGVTFGGRRGPALAEGFRYNVATSSAIVTGRLREGDTYTARTVLVAPVVPDDAQPFGRPLVSEYAQSIIGTHATKWAGDVTGIGPQVRAVAAHLRDHGAYSDGGKGEAEYLPGHGAGRLTTFMNLPRPVGDDEQYAAAFALIVNSLGMPARVVLGAHPGPTGVVRGSDVHAWVEVHLSDGSWAAVPNTEFMPDPSKKPDRQPPQPVDDADAAVVPPPNMVRLPSSLSELDQTNTNARPRTTSDPLWLSVLGFLFGIGVWTGPPVLTVALVCGSIVGLKARRRRRRRHLGSAANRYAAAWHELLDHAHDLGLGPITGRTRHEQAVALGLVELAAAADRTVYGPGDPTEADVTGYWHRIDAARLALGAGVRHWRRALASVNIRSLRLGGGAK
ncbi:hypothetical protein Lfu02_21760 [Longispora fulva]|uniref:Transglutaminase-like putative cysteine protease n=1 Tax=Longispora fulva TaxID=619741 RepID=A0A8J7KSM7_9ACTN|nr:transglutaminase domain-containing protein [Longispora fulva]MBG6139812.1 transglutaminase-like putative cysteine protease [Longispora fulva]GIG57804.1 hypothetical protein Lfu02_21760 [Longispora fulva]